MGEEGWSTADEFTAGLPAWSPQGYSGGSWSFPRGTRLQALSLCAWDAIGFCHDLGFAP